MKNIPARYFAQLMSSARILTLSYFSLILTFGAYDAILRISFPENIQMLSEQLIGPNYVIYVV